MKPIYKYSAIIILIVLAFLWGKGCSSKVIPDNSKKETLKAKVADLKHEEKKLKAEIVYKDSIRNKYVVMWKEVRHDSLIPCPEKLVVADSLIRVDSSLIHSLRADISKLDTIVLFQDSIIRIDSVTIVGLRKEVNKQKRRVVLWKVIASVSAVLNVWQGVGR